MLELDPRRWGYKERMEGRQEGLEEGLEKGLQEGLRRAQLVILLRQLENKFGPLSAADRQRLESANNEQRDIWALKLLNAESLTDVFN